MSLTLAGCSKAPVPPPAMEPAKVAETVTQAFAKSSDEARQAATQIAEAVKSQDSPVAFNELRRLNDQNYLTPEQHAVLAKAMQATFKQMQAAAQTGDHAAQAAMHSYLRTR